jgi:NADH dehydrogenase
VEVWLESKVIDVDEQGVDIHRKGHDAPTRVDAKSVIWAAGIEASRLGADVTEDLDRAGRVKVGPDLSLPAHREVFVLGDMAHTQGPDGQPLPGVAQVAIQGGAHAARCIEADLSKSPRPIFEYRDLGSMATIGRSKAIAWIGRLKLGGLLAWLVWLVVHLMALVGFRNA